MFVNLAAEKYLRIHHAFILLFNIEFALSAACPKYKLFHGWITSFSILKRLKTNICICEIALSRMKFFWMLDAFMIAHVCQYITYY